MGVRNHTVSVSALIINQTNGATLFLLHVVHVSNEDAPLWLNSYILLDNRYTVSIMDQSFQKKLQAKGNDVTHNIASIHLTNDMQTEKVPLKTMFPGVYRIAKYSYDHTKIKQVFKHNSIKMPTIVKWHRTAECDNKVNPSLFKWKYGG